MATSTGKRSRSEGLSADALAHIITRHRGSLDKEILNLTEFLVKLIGHPNSRFTIKPASEKHAAIDCKSYDFALDLVAILQENPVCSPLSWSTICDLAPALGTPFVKGNITVCEDSNIRLSGHWKSTDGSTRRVWTEYEFAGRVDTQRGLEPTLPQDPAHGILEASMEGSFLCATGVRVSETLRLRIGGQAPRWAEQMFRDFGGVMHCAMPPGILVRLDGNGVNEMGSFTLRGVVHPQSSTVYASKEYSFDGIDDVAVKHESPAIIPSPAFQSQSSPATLCQPTAQLTPRSIPQKEDTSLIDRGFARTATVHDISAGIVDGPELDAGAASVPHLSACEIQDSLLPAGTRIAAEVIKLKVAKEGAQQKAATAKQRLVATQEEHNKQQERLFAAESKLSAAVQLVLAITRVKDVKAQAVDQAQANLDEESISGSHDAVVDRHAQLVEVLIRARQSFLAAEANLHQAESNRDAFQQECNDSRAACRSAEESTSDALAAYNHELNVVRLAEVALQSVYASVGTCT